GARTESWLDDNRYGGNPGRFASINCVESGCCRCYLLGFLVAFLLRSRKLALSSQTCSIIFQSVLNWKFSFASQALVYAFGSSMVRAISSESWPARRMRSMRCMASLWG